jgi:hypothetical protein
MSFLRPKNLQEFAKMFSDVTKEVNKEHPSYRNLSATATRVPQCTCPVAASRKDCTAIGILYY